MYGVILQLHMKLQDVDLAVTRTIHIHKHATFRELHEIIQLTFSWWDAHPYCFHLHSEDSKGSTITNDTAKKMILGSHFELEEHCVTYEYGLNKAWRIEITLQKIHLATSQLYPCFIEATHELAHHIIDKHEAVQFPFGKQKDSQQGSLVNRLNEKLKHTIGQFPSYHWESTAELSWLSLQDMTKVYYDRKPWTIITTNEVFVIYDERFDEYLFCTVLGHDNGLYGLSVYKGFNGLLSLHTSLKKRLSMEQLFHIHDNILLQFESNEASEKLVAPSFFINDSVNAQFTSYKPGYFPWKINDEEVAMFTLAVEQTLQLFEWKEKGFHIPNYIEEEELLLLSVHKDNRETKKTYVTFEHMIKKVLPIQLTLTKQQLGYLKKIEQDEDLSVEFSLQYINVPIQRLKNKRPFLPLSSVIVNQLTKEIIYHNIYNARLNYSIVQAEFMQMVLSLGKLPSEIYTDELTYHYLKPLLLLEAFPVKIKNELHITNRVNQTVSQYLVTNSAE